jgi:cytochrome c biogenesis factor
MRKKTVIILSVLLLIVGASIFFTKSKTEEVVEIDPGGTVSVEKMTFSAEETTRIYSKPPVDIDGTVAVTIKENDQSNRKTGNRTG